MGRSPAGGPVPPVVLTGANVGDLWRNGSYSPGVGEGPAGILSSNSIRHSSHQSAKARHNPSTSGCPTRNCVSRSAISWRQRAIHASAFCRSKAISSMSVRLHHRTGTPRSNHDPGPRTAAPCTPPTPASRGSCTVRIPMKWGTNSDGSGAASEQATLVTVMISEVPHCSTRNRRKRLRAAVPSSRTSIRLATYFVQC